MSVKLTIFEEKVVVTTAIAELNRQLQRSYYFKNKYMIDDLSKRITTLQMVSATLDAKILEKYRYTDSYDAVAASISSKVNVPDDSATDV